MTVTLNQAIKVAIECMGKEAQKHAFDSNLYTKGVDTIATRKANKKYVTIVQAMQRLEELMRQGRLFD